MINEIQKRLRSEFAKNVATLTLGTMFAQIIPFLIAPILTRLYTPEQFGLLALFVSVFMIPGNISTLQYESAIMLPKKDEDAFNLVILSLIITVLITLLSLLVVVLFNDQITKLLNNPGISLWLYFIPIPVFLTGLFRTLNIWSSRKKKFKRLALRNITQTVTTAGVKVALGLSKFVNSGLIIGFLCGQFAATSVLAGQTYNDDKNLIRTTSKKRIKQNAIKYRNFPKYTAWQGFFDVVNSSGVSFLISSFFSTAILGLYSFTFGLLAKPLQIIGSAVAQVFYQKSADTFNNNEDVWRITRKVIISLFLLGIPIFLPLLFLGPQIFSFFFGEKWLVAGNYAQLLVPWLYMKFITSPVTSIPQIFNKQRDFFLLSLFINILTPMGLFFLARQEVQFTSVLLIISVLNSLFLITLILWIKKIIG